MVLGTCNQSYVAIHVFPVNLNNNVYMVIMICQHISNGPVKTCTYRAHPMGVMILYVFSILSIKLLTPRFTLLININRLWIARFLQKIIKHNNNKQGIMKKLRR